jgi:hypothetical protein
MPMSDQRAAHEAGSEPRGAAPTERRLPAIELTSVAPGVGSRLAKSIASRRRIIKGTAAAGSAAVALHYVKPTLTALGVPAALAVSSPDDKDKKDKKDKDK